MVQAIQGANGVYEVSFDLSTAEVTVTYDPALATSHDFVTLARTFGYKAADGSGYGGYTPSVSFPENLDVAYLSLRGEVANLEASRVPDKVTVFDFYAQWCGPCKVLDRHMIALLESREDVALRKLNVVDWDTPLARQYLKEVSELPYVVVYARDGRRVADIAGLNVAALDAAVAEAAQ